ncbi:MAG TPA: ABC transporter substrate-binding protein, partial [Stellaceae bacterium]|nr:ABC transporter substrate-binding protein [Stellaceae bacterium]
AAGGMAVLPATVRAATTEQPRKGGTLRIAMPYNPASIDPMTGRNLPDLNVLYACYDALIDFDPNNLMLKPGLAKAWAFKDPKTLVLDLIDGVQFHDGTPLDADAVKFNLDRYRSDPRSNVKSDLNVVGSVDVTGKSQITLHLTRANAGLPAILSNRVGLMLSPKSVKDRGPNVDRIAVGTGPFKFVEWQDNASFTLVKNEKYWRSGLPYLDGIKISIINELNTVVRTVMAGETDLALDLLVQQKLIADRAKTLVVQTGPSLVFYGMFMNYARPPLNDVRIRQALNYGIDREELNKVLNAGLGEPTCAILPKEHWACDPATVDYYKHDPDKARALLKVTGHDGIELPTFGWADQVAMQRQELLMAQLAKSGIRLKLTPTTPQQAMQNFMIEKKGEILVSPTGGYPDPSQSYEVQFAKVALRNAGKIELPGFRPLMDATEEAQDQETRKAAFATLQRFVIEQALQVVQYIAPGVTVMSPKVKNYDAGIIGTPKFQEVWLAA